jgi:hypothetical protein
MRGRYVAVPLTTGPRIGLAAASAVAVAAVAVFFDGGYSAESRVVFGALAVAAAIAFGRDAPRRSWFLAVLLALAALGALSALWALGPVDRTLRWALVTLGYAALFAVAAAAARRRGGVEAIALGLALLAFAAGISGLVAAVTFSAPWAERIAGVWRPGGPFEYPPALALLQVSALPALLCAACGRSRLPAGAAATGLAVAGGVLALSASRVGLAMAVAVGGLALWRGAGRQRMLAAAALGLCSLAGLALAIGAGAPAIGREGDPGRIAVLLAVVAAAAPMWLAARRLLERATPTRRRLPQPAAPRIAYLALIVLAAALAGSLAFGSQAGRGAGAESGFLHGRADTWRAAVHTFAERPLLGTGADSFLAGSARHQRGQTIVFAHSLPLELAAELGIAGLLLALALYAAAVRLIWRARGTTANWLLGPAAAAFLIAGLVDWPWHLAGAGAAWALASGGLAGAAARTKKQLPPHINEGDS